MTEVDLRSLVESPSTIFNLNPEDVITVLLRIRGCLKEDFFVVHPSSHYTLILGDLHGDIQNLSGVLDIFLEDKEVSLVALGDYTDRSPVPGGSVAVAVALLSLKCLYPDRVTLLQGNHENYYLFPFVPYDLPEEVLTVWGEGRESEGILYVLSSILAKLPAIALSSNGILFTHGGLIKERVREGMSHKELEKEKGEEWYRGTMYSLLWGGPKGYGQHYAPGADYSESDLMEALREYNAVVHVRGHDPGLNGRFLFSERDLTIISFGEHGLYSIVEGKKRIEEDSVLSSLKLYPIKVME